MSPPVRVENIVKRDRSGRPFVTVCCATCSRTWAKRHDSIKGWGGLCGKCAVAKTSALPHVVEARRCNGVAVMARVGKLPHYPERNYRSGPANNMWRGGITPESQKVRMSAEMQNWRKAVFTRDDYTCQLCGSRSGAKQADHIKPFALHRDLRFSLDNGRTLCVPCHRAYGAKVCNGVLVREATLSLGVI